MEQRRGTRGEKTVFVSGSNAVMQDPAKTAVTAAVHGIAVGPSADHSTGLKSP